MSKTGVYAITHKTSKTTYVGSAARAIVQRWGEHRYLLRRGKHRNPHLQAAWTKYGERAFRFTILEECAPEDVLVREQAWVDTYRIEGRRLYNIRDWVKSQAGMRHSEDAKKRIGSALKGRSVSAETRFKLSAARKGKAPVAAIVAHTFEWPPLCSPSGEVLTITNLNAFCTQNGLDVSAMRKVALGKRSSHHGWRLAGAERRTIPSRAREWPALMSPDGTVYKHIVNLAEFGRTHGVDDHALRSVCNHLRPSHKGWTLP